MAEISIGAIGAAIVAGMISLLTLIISKEQKVSDFRQAWIDSLRSELVNFITSINSLFDLNQIEWNDEDKRHAAFSPVFEDVNTATFSVSLRLNPDEEMAQEVLRYMDEISSLVANASLSSELEIRRLEGLFLLSSKQLLKIEWQRVKTGESAFRITKGVIVAAIFVAPLLIALTR